MSFIALSLIKIRVYIYLSECYTVKVAYLKLKTNIISGGQNEFYQKLLSFRKVGN